MADDRKPPPLLQDATEEELREILARAEANRAEHRSFAVPGGRLEIIFGGDTAHAPPELVAKLASIRDAASLGEAFGAIFDSVGARFFDREGNRITFSEAAALRADPTYRIVGRDALPWGGYVSTVWLGMERGTDKQGRPLIFESIVFHSADPEDERVYAGPRCYATAEEARVGHAEALEVFRFVFPPRPDSYRN